MNRGLAVLGIGAVVLGVAAFVEPSLLGSLSLPGLFVGIIGFVALVQGIYFAYGRLDGDGEPDLPEPERRRVATVPGDDFDEQLGRATSGRVAYNTREQTAIRDDLERVAVAVLVRADGVSPETARERLKAGTWTDDAMAAALFSPDVMFELSLTARLRASVASNVAFRRQARTAIDELSDRLEAR